MPRAHVGVGRGGPGIHALHESHGALIGCGLWPLGVRVGVARAKIRNGFGFGRDHHAHDIFSYNTGMDRHNRQSHRLPGYDYAQPGAYFVTICTHARATLFGEIIRDTMDLNEFGNIAFACWQSIPRHFPLSRLDAFVVMPNHVHAILWITDYGQGAVREALPLPDVPKGTTPNSLGAMIQNYKSVTTRKINQARQLPGTPVWQRDYYDKIMRGEDALRRVREYITSNPLAWAIDEENPMRVRGSPTSR